MSDFTPRQHALRVAVLSTLMDQVKAALMVARSEAQETFAEVRADGQTQQKVLLPDGTELGLISIRGGGQSVDFGEPGTLLAWCETNASHAVERYVDEGAWSNAEVIDHIAAKFPNLVRERVRASSLVAFRKQAEETGGFLIDDDGAKHKLAEVAQNGPTGAFAYRAGPGARDRIMTEWMTGRLREIALGPLALPGGEPGE